MRAPCHTRPLLSDCWYPNCDAVLQDNLSNNVLCIAVLSLGLLDRLPVALHAAQRDAAARLSLRRAREWRGQGARFAELRSIRANLGQVWGPGRTQANVTAPPPSMTPSKIRVRR